MTSQTLRTKAFSLLLSLFFALGLAACAMKQQVRRHKAQRTTKVESSSAGSDSSLARRPAARYAPRRSESVAKAAPSRAPSRARRAPSPAPPRASSRAPLAGGARPSPPPRAADSIATKRLPLPPIPAKRHVQVKEADLYRVKGSILFYLHTYRGLTIFDLRDPKRPKRLASLPVYGTPVEMFVERRRAFILVNDVMYLVQKGKEFSFQKRNTAQLLSVDISNPEEPEVLHAMDVPGRLREGVSRKVGDAVYVTTLQRKRKRIPYTAYRYKYHYYRNRYSYRRYRRYKRVPYTAYRYKYRNILAVHSYNVGNPRRIKKLNSLELLNKTQGVNRRYAGGYEREYYSNYYTISATQNMLMVAERWYRNHHRYLGYQKAQYRYSRYYRYRRRYYKRRCVWYDNGYYTKVNLIDISNPQGKIKLYSRFKIRGHMGDQFKQTTHIDRRAKKRYYYGVVMRNSWPYNSCNNRRRQRSRNALIAVDISAPDSPQVSHVLHFGKPHETVRGSLFDHKRKVLYAITARRRDPLYAISFKNPAKPEVLSAVDGLSGDMNVFRTIHGGDFLLAIGRDTSSSCTGFGRGWRGSRVAVSIIDVRKLNNIRLVQRQCVKVKHGFNSQSQANRNRDQAHKMIGVFQDGSRSIVTVPVTFRARVRYRRWWRYAYQSAVGIMRFNIQKYQPHKSERAQQVLQNLGTVVHPHGRVKRTIVLKLFSHKGARRIVLNLSSNHLSIVDLQNLQKPQRLTSLAISPNVRAVYRFKRILVEHSSVGTGVQQFNSFRVRRLSRRSRTPGAVIRTVRTGPIVRTMRWKQYLVTFHYGLNEVKSGNTYVLRQDTNRAVVKMYDFSKQNPLTTIMRLPFHFTPPRPSYCGSYQSGSGVDSSSIYATSQIGRKWHATSEGFVFAAHSRSKLWGRLTYHHALVFLNLKNPKKPSYRMLTLPYGNQRSLLGISPSTFYLVQHHSRNQYISYVQRWFRRNQRWFQEPWIPVAGRIARAWHKDGKLMMLSYNPHNRLLQLLEVDPKTRQSKTHASVQMNGLRNVLFANQTLYAITQHGNQSKLGIFRLNKKSFQQKFHNRFINASGVLRCVRNNKLLIQFPKSLLVADVSQPDAPRGLYFRSFAGNRYNSIATPMHVAFDGKQAYVAAGLGGVFHLPLSRASRLVQRKYKTPKTRLRWLAKHKTLLQIAYKP